MTEIVYDTIPPVIVVEDNGNIVTTVPTSEETIIPIVGGSNQDLETLQNVDATNLQNGSSLVYNTSTAKWVTQIIDTTTHVSVDELTNVDTTNLQNGSLLIYNINTAKWVADINLVEQNMDAGEF